MKIYIYKKPGRYKKDAGKKREKYGILGQGLLLHLFTL